MSRGAGMTSTARGGGGGGAGGGAETAPQLQRFPLGMNVRRVLWGAAWWVLFRPSPRVLHRWRNVLLRAFGARLHPTARVYPTARVWAPWNLEMHEHACIGDWCYIYTVDRVTIGRRSTVSQFSFLCTASHDFEDPRHPLTTAPITIGERAWVAVDVFVGPGVRIGDGAVVGARSSVFKDVPAWVLAVGSPARAVRERVIRAEGADDGADDGAGGGGRAGASDESTAARAPRP